MGWVRDHDKCIVDVKLNSSITYALVAKLLVDFIGKGKYNRAILRGVVHGDVGSKRTGDDLVFSNQGRCCNVVKVSTVSRVIL